MNNQLTEAVCHPEIFFMKYIGGNLLFEKNDFLKSGVFDETVLNDKLFKR